MKDHVISLRSEFNTHDIRHKFVAVCWSKLYFDSLAILQVIK